VAIALNNRFRRRSNRRFWITSGLSVNREQSGSFPRRLTVTNLAYFLEAGFWTASEASKKLSERHKLTLRARVINQVP
jgi:hypothetical protein